jgi:HEAT repeat protein
MGTDASRLAGLASADADERASAAAAAGAGAIASERTTRTLRRLALHDPEPRVRAVALAALTRAARRADALGAWGESVTDPAAPVRRRAAELAPGLRAPSGPLVLLLHDPDPLVAEAAAFALGERGARAGSRAVAALSAAATDHRDALVREASVAALGAIGDERGKPAVLHACTDKPAIRRRAVLALAAFEGDDVEGAIRRALGDRDWQVRQAAEDLTAG